MADRDKTFDASKLIREAVLLAKTRSKTQVNITDARNLIAAYVATLRDGWLASRDRPFLYEVDWQTYGRKCHERLIANAKSTKKRRKK